MKRETYSKRERIVSQKLINEMFVGDGSQSMAAFPVRAVYIIKEREEGAPGVQVLMSVSKRRFRHAVDRNRVKRQLREAFRRHRPQLADAVGEDRSVKIAFIWLSGEHAPSHVVDQRVSQLLNRIAHRL